MLKEVFGISIRYEDWNKENSLPLYIIENYDFQLATIDKQQCIILTVKGDLVTIPALKKQIKRIQELDNLPVVLSLPTLSSYRRKSLIENKIPFITEKQVYLPFMGTLLLEEKEPEKELDKFMFSTQQLVLFYFYSGKERLYMAEATERLPFTAMTLSRAVKQLEATGLFTVSKDGVNKVIKAKYDKLELFEKLKKYLSSPVRRMGYLEKADITEDMVLAGESELSKLTMLNPSKIETYAIYYKNFHRKQAMEELLDPDKQICLEVWEYDPKLFTGGNVADYLSVVLSLKENEDERIEEAIESLLEKELGK